MSATGASLISVSAGKASLSDDLLSAELSSSRLSPPSSATESLLLFGCVKGAESSSLKERPPSSSSTGSFFSAFSAGAGSIRSASRSSKEVSLSASGTSPLDLRAAFLDSIGATPSSTDSEKSTAAVLSAAGLSCFFAAEIPLAPPLSSCESNSSENSSVSLFASSFDSIFFTDSPFSLLSSFFTVSSSSVNSRSASFSSVESIFLTEATASLPSSTGVSSNSSSSRSNSAADAVSVSSTSRLEASSERSSSAESPIEACSVTSVTDGLSPMSVTLAPTSLLVPASTRRHTKPSFRNCCMPSSAIAMSTLD